MRGFAPILSQKPRVLFLGFATVGSKFGYLTPLLAGIGRLLNTSNTYTTRTVGVANRARHERLCLDRPDADVVAE